MSEEKSPSVAAENERIEKAAKAKKAAKDVKVGPKVAEGKSITSPRGILGPGEIVTPADFNGGEAQIKKFLESGHLVK